MNYKWRVARGQWQVTTRRLPLATRHLPLALLAIRCLLPLLKHLAQEFLDGLQVLVPGENVRDHALRLGPRILELLEHLQGLGLQLRGGLALNRKRYIARGQRELGHLATQLGDDALGGRSEEHTSEL